MRYPATPLTDGGVALRRWSRGDLPLVQEAASDAALLPGTTLPRRFTRDEGLAFIERQLEREASGDGLSLAITLDGAAVGCATLMMRRAEIADVGYWVVDRVRGKGVGGRAVGLLVEWVLRQGDVEAVDAFVADENTASRRLLERLGFSAVDRRRHRVNDVDEELLVYRRSTRRSGDDSR